MQEQLKLQALEEQRHMYGNRRPTVRTRGRGPASQISNTGGPVTVSHLLDGSGNILAVTVGVDQLTNA